MLHPSQGHAWKGSSWKSLAVLQKKLLARQPLTGPLQPGCLLPPSVWNSLNLLVIRTQQKSSVWVNLTEKEFAGEAIIFFLFIPRWDTSLESTQQNILMSLLKTLVALDCRCEQAPQGRVTNGMWLRGKRPICKQWEYFQAERLGKQQKNSERSPKRDHSPNSLDSSENVPKVTGQDLTSAISHVPALKKQTNRNPKCHVTFTAGDCSFYLTLPILLQPFPVPSLQPLLLPEKNQARRNYLLWTERAHPSLHVHLPSPSKCMSHHHGPALDLIEFLPHLHWCPLYAQLAEVVIMYHLGIWPFESIRVKMIVMSSPHQPYTLQEKDCSRESNSWKGNLRPFSESPEYWITATEGESSYGLINQSIQPSSSINQGDFNENQMLLKINQKAVLTTLTFNS